MEVKTCRRGRYQEGEEVTLQGIQITEVENEGAGMNM